MNHFESINRIKINRNSALYAFMLIPFFRPSGLELKVLPFLGTIFFVWELVAIVLFIIIRTRKGMVYVINSGNKCQFIEIYVVYTFVISIIMKFIIKNDKIPLVSLLMFCSSTFIVAYIANEDFEKLIDILYKYLYFINVMNALFVIIPGLNTAFSDEHYFFIGHRQAISMVWIMSVFILLIKDASDRNGKKKINKTIHTILFFGVATFNLVFVFSEVTTGVFVFAAFIILYIIMIVFNKFNSIHNLAMYAVFIGGLVVNYLIITINIQEYFAAFLSTYLGESSSLGGRIVIYRAFYQAYKKSRIFGYGFYGIKTSTGWGGAWNALDYAHNTILQELTDGGLVGLFFFIVMGLYAIHNACKTNNLYIKKVVLCALAAYMVIMITESTNQYHYYMLFLVLITYISKLNTPLSRNNKR